MFRDSLITIPAIFYLLSIASSIATRGPFHYARGVFEELKGGRCNFIFIKEDSSSWIIIKFRISRQWLEPETFAICFNEVYSLFRVLLSSKLNPFNPVQTNLTAHTSRKIFNLKIKQQRNFQ